MVFSLNGVVAELSRGESAGQAHLLLTLLGMSSGVEEMVPMAGYGQKEDELDGSINCKPLIDGLLIKKAVSQKQKPLIHLESLVIDLYLPCLL